MRDAFAVATASGSARFFEVFRRGQCAGRELHAATPGSDERVPSVLASACRCGRERDQSRNQ